LAKSFILFLCYISFNLFYVSYISQGKIKFEKFNYVIANKLEQKVRGLVEIRDKVKRDLNHCEVNQ